MCQVFVCLGTDTYEYVGEILLTQDMKKKERRETGNSSVLILSSSKGSIDTVETAPPVLATCQTLTLMALLLFSCTSSKDTAFSGGVSTGYQTSLTLIPLGVASLPSPALLDPTPKLATPLTSLLPTASTAPIGYADHQSACLKR